MGSSGETEQSGLTPKPASSSRFQIFRREALIFVAIYIGGYAVMSALGTYEWTFTGKMRYPGGLPVSDVRRWSPAWCELKTFTSINGSEKVDVDGFGWLFYPLIRLDRAFVHQDEFPFNSTK